MSHTPYSLQHVDCSYCEKCTTPNCLLVPEIRRKCKAAFRRDDLKKHTKTNHSENVPKAVEDRQRTIKTFLDPKQSKTSEKDSSRNIVPKINVLIITLFRAMFPSKAFFRGPNKRVISTVTIPNMNNILKAYLFGSVIFEPSIKN